MHLLSPVPLSAIMNLSAKRNFHIPLINSVQSEFDRHGHGPLTDRSFSFLIITATSHLMIAPLIF